MKKCARILATCFKAKRVVEKTLLAGHPLGYYYHSQNFTTEQDIIELLKFNIKQEKKIDPGLQRDLIIVNSDIGSEIGNEFVMSLEGEPLQKGNIRVIQRSNVGLSFGAYSDAFKLFRNEYEYFIFTEDDLSILENNYVKKSIELFESSKNAGFLAFVGKTKIKRGHWKALGITEKKNAFGCHGACGLSSSKILGEIFDAHGMLPHNQTDEYQSGITFGEVALPLAISRAGYELVDQPKDTYFAIPSYDVMRGIKVVKFPNSLDKLIFYLKHYLHRLFSINKYTKKFYIKILSLRKKIF